MVTNISATAANTYSSLGGYQTRPFDIPQSDKKVPKSFATYEAHCFLLLLLLLLKAGKCLVCSSSSSYVCKTISWENNRIFNTVQCSLLLLLLLLFFLLWCAHRSFWKWRMKEWTGRSTSTVQSKQQNYVCIQNGDDDARSRRMDGWKIEEGWAG